MEARYQMKVTPVMNKRGGYIGWQIPNINKYYTHNHTGWIGTNLPYEGQVLVFVDCKNLKN